MELKRRSLFIFYFEFEYRKHRTIKRDAKRWLEDVKVFDWDTNHPRESQNHILMHLVFWLFQYVSEVSTWGRKFPVTSDKGLSASCFNLDRKFWSSVRSSDNHLTSALMASFGARVFIPHQPLFLVLLTFSVKNTSKTFHKFSPHPPRANPWVDLS
jgi:hypothetical protein